MLNDEQRKINKQFFNYIERKYGTEYLDAFFKSDLENQHDEEGRYQKLLNDARKKTLEVVYDANPNIEYTIEPYKIVGVEFSSWNIEKKYGCDVYKRVCEEVPYEKIPKDNGEFFRMFKRDYSLADQKLGYIIREGICASPLIDLDLLIELLEVKGIPSYIDYEKNLFYYNEVPEKIKIK